MNMVNVRLVADRENFKDALYGSGVTWAGKGDIRKVPEDIALRLKNHADVYEIVQAGPTLDSLAIPRLGDPTSEAVEAIVAITANMPHNQTQAEAKAAIAPLGEDPIAEAEKAAPRAWTPEMLTQVKDGAIRAEIERRGYKVAPSYAGTKLREKFLQAQGTGRE